MLSDDDGDVTLFPFLATLLLGRHSSDQFPAHRRSSCASLGNEGGEDQSDLPNLAPAKLTSCTAN